MGRSMAKPILQPNPHYAAYLHRQRVSRRRLTFARWLGEVWLGILAVTMSTLALLVACR